MPAQPSEGSRTLRILVADDEPHIRRILITLLQNAEYQVVEARDGREALEVLREDTDFDFLVLDLMMPHASGIEVLEYVRGEAGLETTPVIILTAKGQDTDRDDALANGADDFMTKPFSPKKLLARIEELLAAR